MAETKEVLIEVKLDLKDAKTENSYLKNWVNWMKCYVKIEAIECFPCYLKISFYHEDDLHREYPFSVIRLNIPGVSVGSAASRTKSYTYGVLWKSNRKRCRLFMAFPDKQTLSMHMEWLKRSIDSLEQYRKEILENHRISNTKLTGILVDKTPTDNDKSFLNSTKSSLNDTQTERDMNDILGPLPDIPISVAECSRWSVRRSSGCSGIYEEIMDPSTDSNVKRDSDAPRGSIVSAIYVDMTTPVHSKGSESTEMPPPLPPRRRPHNPIYTPMNPQTDTNTKTRKSTWNLKNVFGRTKTSEQQNTIPLKSHKGTPIEFIKSQTTSGISKICLDDCNTNLLANRKNSFSTPDLTNILDTASTTNIQPIATKTVTSAIASTNKNEIDETDLDVMDIERSNSLNCATNQFVCRPAPLNISANILWSHNLSITMSSSCDSSAINLIGANVNSKNSFLGRDMSGYCRMVPIIKSNSPDLKSMAPTPSPKPTKVELKRSSTTITSEMLREHTQLIDNSSDYCAMAPILPKAEPKTDDEKWQITKNITFERHFEFDEEFQGILDCSMKSIGNSTGANDETSSSGVSSDDGNAISNLTTTKSASISNPSMNSQTMTIDRLSNDDNISLTYTESPPESAKSNNNNEMPFSFHTTKFDEKIPSYFPNENTLASPSCDVTKYTVNNKITKPPPPPPPPSLKKTRSKSVESPNSKAKSITHINNAVKKSNYKTVMKTPTSGKVQKLKQRRNSTSEGNHPIEVHPISSSYTNENWCTDSAQNLKRKYKTMPKPNSYEGKGVLSHLDPNTTKFESRQANFEKNVKITRSTSSPRRIYNKWCSKPPTVPIQIPNSRVEPLPNSFESNLRATSSDLSSGSLIRSWTRFRRIDFSPLKTKINNILQRTPSEF